VLVLDDLGAERATDWVVKDVLFPIIAYRHAHLKQTIITTNRKLDELAEYYSHSEGDASRGVATARRIRERCGQGEWVIDMDSLPNLSER
jgi:DNA replication protein DnaC